MSNYPPSIVEHLLFINGFLYNAKDTIINVYYVDPSQLVEGAVIDAKKDGYLRKSDISLTIKGLLLNTVAYNAKYGILVVETEDN